jgi:hypothetical protein
MGVNINPPTPPAVGEASALVVTFGGDWSAGVAFAFWEGWGAGEACEAD